jgi:hypothetical protein
VSGYVVAATNVPRGQFAEVPAEDYHGAWFVARHLSKTHAGVSFGSFGVRPGEGSFLVASFLNGRGGRVALAAWRFAWGRIPRWLRRLLAACLAFPGPLDEAAGIAVAVVFVLVPLAVSAGARRELASSVRDAWRGDSQVTPA